MKQLLLCVLLILPFARAALSQTQTDPPTETHYLAFQIFTGTPDQRTAIGNSGKKPVSPLPTADAMRATTEDILHRIGSVGSRRTHLAVIFGPLSFDHSDTEIGNHIATVFDMALKLNVAVGFHVDDSMFWAGRADLLTNPANIEWIDWNGTPNTGRRIEWGPKAEQIPPQMCFNSKPILAEVQRRATGVIGKSIKAGIDRLRSLKKEYLFAGVLAGWETQIGQDFDTGRDLGFHALTNLGFSKGHPPKDLDGERVKIVQEFITYWCKGLAEGGVPVDKIYSHTAFLSRQLFVAQDFHSATYAVHNHFAPPSAAFGKYHRPGFSTYPQPGLFAQIYDELVRHKQIGWASSEGTNLQLGSGPGQSGMNMETYLAKMFNHGAALVDVFSWGVGGESNKNMDFRVVTEGEEALQAYRKFLRGDKLIETASTGASYLERLPAKIKRIQSELPTWITKTGKQAQAEPLMRELETALKAHDFTSAEKAADKLLALLSTK